MNRIIVISQTFDTEIVELEDLFVAQSQLKVIDQGYQETTMETPEWVLDKMEAVNVEINHRVASQLKARLRAAQARRSALRTADEKRGDLDAEIEDLKKRLGQ